MTTADPVRVIADLFAAEGASEYLGEPVSQAAHMLQAAALAEGPAPARNWWRRRCCTTWGTSPGRCPATS